MRMATSCRPARAGRATRTAARSPTAASTAARPRSASATSPPSASRCARSRRCAVPGIHHGYVNVGQIAGGTNTNVVPGKVVLKVDRRMIPEEDPVAVEAALRALIDGAAAGQAGISVEIKRLLLAHAMQPLP